MHVRPIPIPSPIFVLVKQRSLPLVNMACGVDGESHDLLEEVQLLQAIYIHELELQGPEARPTSLTLFLHPSTGDDDHTSKYVCLSLHLVIPEEYPCITPEVSIQNPRGLSEAHIDSIQENLIELAKDKTGSSMLFDLIEYTKDCLTDNNIPSCPCAVCLEHFEKEGSFIKTKCYHYFHSVCLQKCIRYSRAEDKNTKMVCPMCRRDIDEVDLGIEDEQIVLEDIVNYKPDEKEQKAQKERQRIFEYQKAKNGIINVEEERDKYLIGIKNIKHEFGNQGNIQFNSTSLANETGKNETIKVEEQPNESEREGLQWRKKDTRDWAGNSATTYKNLNKNKQADRGEIGTRKEYHRRQNYRKPRGKQNKEAENSGGPGIVGQEGTKTNCLEREKGKGITKIGRRDYVDNKADRHEKNFSRRRENLDMNNQKGIKDKDSGHTVHKNTTDDKVMENSCSEEHHETNARSNVLKSEKEISETSIKNSEFPQKNPRKRFPRKPRGDSRISETVPRITWHSAKGISPGSKNERGSRIDERRHSARRESRQNYDERTKEFPRKIEQREALEKNLRKNDDERTNDFPRKAGQGDFLGKNLKKSDEKIIKNFQRKAEILVEKKSHKMSEGKYRQFNEGTEEETCRPPPGFEGMYRNREKGVTNPNK